MCIRDSPTTITKSMSSGSECGIKPFEIIWLNINGTNSNKSDFNFYLLTRLFLKSNYSITFLQEPMHTIAQPHAISGFTFFGPFSAWAAWPRAHLRPAAWPGGAIGWNRATLGTCLGLLAHWGWVHVGGVAFGFKAAPWVRWVG